MSSIVVAGDTSGSVTLQAPAVAGAVVVTLPSVSGTMAVTGDSPSFTNLAYTGTLTGGTGVVNLGSGQFYKDASGNVGIGVTPSAWASGSTAIQNAGKGVIWQFGGTNMYVGQNYYYDGSNRIYISTNAATEYQQGAGVHRWYIMPSGTAGTAVTTFTQAMTLDNSGDFMVGDTNPQSCRALISVASNKKLLGLRNTGTLSGGTPVLEILPSTNTTNNSYYTIQTGVLGVAYRFQVADSGNVTNTNNSYGAISDVKLKENIVDATPKLDALCNVKVRNFNFIGSENKQLGVIAQELETVFPSMIDEAPDKDMDGNDLGTTTKQVKYSVFVPMLIKAIQELNAKVTALEAQLGAK